MVERRRIGLVRVLSIVSNLVLVGTMLGFVLLAVGPHLLGYRTQTMLTGSMAPEIEPGDVVVTVPTPTRDLRVGDMVSYSIPVEDHRVETHRVVEVDRTADGSVAIRTKGDANQGVDPWTAVITEDTVWEVRAVVPRVGTAIRVLRNPLIQGGALWLALGGAVVLGLTTIWGRPRHRRPVDADPHSRGSGRDAA